MRTNVAIIGAGPAGLLLSQLLHMAGIASTILECRSRDYVERRVRAGVLEQGTVALMEQVDVADRLHREALIHDGFNIGVNGRNFRIDLADLTPGGHVTVYGQTEMTRDLIAAALKRGTPILFETDDAMPCGIETESPYVTFTRNGEPGRLDCDFIAGCDGWHGVSRFCLPEAKRRVFERIFKVGWLGILADVPPCLPELLYSNHERGFALASMRSPTRSRY